MKKKIYIATAAVASLLLTGCGNTQELSEQNQNMIAQYMAGTLLKYDADYNGALVYDRAILEATPTPAPTQAPVVTPAPTASSNSSDNSNNATAGDDNSKGVLQETDLSSLINVSGIKVKKTSYKVTKSFGTAYSSVAADKGHKLLIVNFKLKNQSDSSKKVNLTGKNIKYTLSIGDNRYSPLYTIADGDMQFFNEKIAAGSSKKGILVFQIKSSVKVKDAVVTAITEDSTADIKIK